MQYGQFNTNAWWFRFTNLHVQFFFKTTKVHVTLPVRCEINTAIAMQYSYVTLPVRCEINTAIAMQYSWKIFKYEYLFGKNQILP